MGNIDFKTQKTRLQTVLMIYQTARKDPENSAEFNAILSIMEHTAREKLSALEDDFDEF